MKNNDNNSLMIAIKEYCAYYGSSMCNKSIEKNIFDFIIYINPVIDMCVIANLINKKFEEERI